jgi:uncharacterized protein (TIGR03437 family)
MRELTKGYNSMSHSYFTKILIVLTALLVCVSLMQAQGVSPLSATPTTVALTYQKPATAGSTVPVSIKATPSAFFTVDATSVPIWLGLSATSGTATSSGVNLTFSPPAAGVLIGAGSYYATVKLDVVGASAMTVLSIPVTLVVTDPAPVVTVTGGAGLSFTWTQFSPLPTVTLNAVSSNEPVAFTVTAAVSGPTAPANWIQVNHASGVAYSWGTPVVVSFNSLVAVDSVIGNTMAGTVTITPAGGSPIVTNVAILVAPPVAAISATNGLFPAAIPVQTTSVDTDLYVIAVSGSGFVSGTTVVKVAGDVLDGLTNGAAIVVNSSTMMLRIPTKKYLETAGPVVITAKNNTPDTAATATLTVTTAPIIYAVTNSASYQQESQTAPPNVAPYDLISIFGDNFGPTAGAVVVGAPDTSFFKFPVALASGGHNIAVNFYKADGKTVISQTPLLFGSEFQINALVPAGVAGNTTVNLSVTYNGVESAKLVANVVVADPGIFTTAANGTEQGAILNSDYTANSSTAKANLGSTVMIYMAGLGSPTSTGADTASTTAAAFPKSCVSTVNYMGAVNGQTVKPSPLWNNIDGAVIQGGLLLANVFPPCFATSPTVTIGGKAATVTYAGFVSGSVSGLYQINATIPTGVTVPTNNLVPVVVSVGTATSQPGVTMAVVATGGH